MAASAEHLLALSPVQTAPLGENEKSYLLKLLSRDMDFWLSLDQLLEKNLPDTTGFPEHSVATSLPGKGDWTRRVAKPSLRHVVILSAAKNLAISRS